MKQLVTNELERMQKEVVVAYPQVLFIHLPEWAQKMKILSQDRWDLNLGTPTWSRNTTWPWCICDIYEKLYRFNITQFHHAQQRHHFVSKTQMQFKHYKDIRGFDLRKIQFQITTGSNSTHIYRIYSNRKWPLPGNHRCCGKYPHRTHWNFVCHYNKSPTFLMIN
jgi:hypothetical protein